MAERKAMASGFSLSAMATDGGCWRKVATGGGAGRGRVSVCSSGASWAMVAVGVMGDTGGRLGEADSERFRECAEDDEAALDEAGRAAAFVSTRSAGMATTCRAARPRVVVRTRGGALGGPREAAAVAAAANREPRR